ncbi:MAG: Zn-ribbon domain-containing OB-fold protein [Thermoplasmatota archaeon]
MSVVKKVERIERIKYVQGSFPVWFAYTVPDHLEHFFQKLRREGSMIGAKCESCGTVYFPPVWFCERCFVRVRKEVVLPANGRLEAFTVAHLGAGGERLRNPEVYGLIRLEGASTVLLHRVLASPEELRAGMEVRARLKEPKKRRGSITDIEGFEPSGESASVGRVRRRR